MNALSEQTAIVTGAGTGIGHAVALALAREGTRVVICGRRAEPLEKTVAAITQMGGNGLSVQADVSHADDVGRLVKTTIDTYGTAEILINNAGIDGSGYIHEHDIETWDRVLAVNLRGPFLLARAVLPMMRARQHGHIVNISSESGLEYYAGNGAYGVAKHALNALGEFIQRENQALGVRVDTICPGMVVTEMTQDEPGLLHDRCLYPEDIADLVIWLLTRRPNIKIGRPILIQTMENPWQ
ncbi:MAG: SDR family NAD(P)-dependent oxidoreductase [Anaerolineae bacterium]|jgi:3-oxoacyl-[acyl-carrier protein] reductase